jgi:hypothetical protein
MNQIEQKHYTMDSFFGRLLETLDIEDQMKHEIHGFITANQDWKQSREEKMAIAQAWAKFEKKELQVSNLPREQLSKPHGHGPVLFALNCNTMPKNAPPEFGPEYDLKSPTLRAILAKQRSAMSLAELGESGFLIELVHRRFWHDPKRSKQPYAHLSKSLLDLHSSLRKELWEITTNPFALLLGKASFEWYTTIMDPELVRKVPFSNDKIFGVQACLYIEYDEQSHIRRLSLPALHPSATYYNLSLQHHAKISDTAWNFVLSASGKEMIDDDFYVRRAGVIRDLAGRGQVKTVKVTLPKASPKPKQVSRPAAPLGFRYEQSGQYVPTGILRKSWMYGMELAQAEESGLHVEQRDHGDLSTEEYQLNGLSYQRPLEAEEILAEKEIGEDSDGDDEDQEEPTDKKYFSELDPEEVEEESRKALLNSDQMKARLIEFVVRTVKKEQDEVVMSSVTDWPTDIVKYLASKGLYYKDDKRTTAPIRVLSADMVLRGIATPSQLQWPQHSKKELLMILMNRSSTGLLDSNRIKSQEHFKANGFSNLIAARKARAVRDEQQTAKAIALVDDYEKKHGSVTSAATIRKRQQKDAADLANGMPQKEIDERNNLARAQQASHIRMKIRANLAGVKSVTKFKGVERMLAEKAGNLSAILYQKLEMPDEKLTKGCYNEALKVLPAWLAAREERVNQMKKEGKNVHGKNANLAPSIGEKAYKKLKQA